MTEEPACRLFDLLLTLLLAENMPQATVAQHLKAVAQATRHVPERLGRKYLIIKGAGFQLSAVFEKPSFNLYQVTLRLQPAAYAQVKAHARSLPTASPRGVVAEWRNEWFGLLPKLVVYQPRPELGQVTARFTGPLPHIKFVVLTKVEPVSLGR
jgi:hypothetical protein